MDNKKENKKTSRNVFRSLKENISKIKKQKQFWKWMFIYTKPFIFKLLILLLISVANTVLTLAMTLTTKEIIDEAIAGGLFVNAIIAYVLLTIVSMVVDVLGSILGLIWEEKFSFGIRKEIYERIIRSKWLGITRYHTGDLMTRITSDASSISVGITGTIPAIIQLIVEFVLVFGTLFYYSPILAILGVLVAPVSMITGMWFAKKLKVLQQKVLETESAYRSYMQESMANLLVVKSFANEEYAVDRLVELRDNRFSWVYKKSKLSVASSTMMKVTFNIAYISAYVIGATKVASKAITYGTMSVFLTLVNRVQAPIVQLAQQIPKIVAIMSSAQRLIEIQEIDIEERLEENIGTENMGLMFRNVNFSYTGKEEDNVFEDCNMVIAPGEFVAVLGESGIGKTTLIRLVMAFLEKSKGDIVFFNMEGEYEPANALARKFISYVPQGNTLFSGSIRANIRMGNLEATEDDMIEALKMASAYDFVSELPNGLDTIIGERGHGLSEGQAQRIAIARAFVRKSPFLILDEATSALDTETEMKVLQGLKDLFPRPTCLIITHRRSILECCDKEMMINNRKIELVNCK